MKKNIKIIVSIIMLFVVAFFIGNQDYFSTKNPQIVEDGAVTITTEQLNKTVKLEGEWSFYPNVLIPSWESLDIYKNKRISIDVPANWQEYVQPNVEGLAVGTYHIKVKVPVEGHYGLYIRTIRQSNRVFINGVDVGAKGNPSTTLNDYRTENDDKYTVFARSENKELDIIIHVANFHYPQAGIIYPIEFGTMQEIQHHYRLKVLADTFVSIGYIVFGIIYVLAYVQNRRRKEELCFGLFTIVLGLYMSFINQKVFFLLIPNMLTSSQVRLQLGILPIALMCLTLFIYFMYPQLTKKRIIYAIMILLGIVFVVYGIYNPFTHNQMATSTEALIIRKLAFIAVTAPVVLYNVWILIRVMLKRLEEARYILIVLAAICCYAILLVLNFLTGIPIDYSEFVLFILVLLGFASLLNYRSNIAFMKIQALSEELLAHNQMKDEFLLKTSHELRTPLNGILNLSKLLMEGAQGPLKRAQQEQVILIHNVTQRLGHLVEDLLFSSNYMTGEVRVSPRAVPISVINEVIEEIRSVMPKNGHVRLIDEVDLALPAMLTDELRFKQVLYSLLHNAIQHTEIGEITVRAYVHHEHMVIQVSDTGLGIPPQELERIFNAFYQVKNNHKKEGLGLGLSIAKNIVEKLNGDIHVKSLLGEGTTFTFTMPLATDEQFSDEKSLAMVTHKATEVLQLKLPLIYKGNDKRILVVDDDHVNIKVLTDALSLKGYTVIAVDNGFDAVDYIKTNQVDCMLIDLMMNGMSGYELCKQVRKQYDMLELPIIILTAIMKQSDLVLTLQVGANDYLQKPIAMDELFIRIESLLAVRQSSIDAIEVEMNYLYSQVTPHFVYNTLNTIIGLSYTDMDNTREALYCLATYFRAKLNVHYRNSFVSIEEEIELVKAYLYIEKMRFGDRLTIKYDIDESIQLMIPALSIQPFVENAVFHGISKKQEGGTIEVSVQREGQFVRIKIYDNGVGIPDDKLQQLLNEESSRIGFTNPLKKFKLIKNASLRLYSEEGKGTTILLLLPEGGGA
ncbi:ATP-binding protein [Lysinibacillus sp. FJAT-14222]|uniref:ATP-binding protein n=1 Tax=Lysinibacillus sp. FJAT-14222 TaxID=1932366 RepID=UPI0006B0281F|nr:ATP-binding protein [Lysinibacillus sp. FJAT-14222]KOS63957.1 histidine kinase [Lysinibacillus sp. FJAT-14222]